MSWPFLPRYPFWSLFRASGFGSVLAFARATGVHRREMYRWAKEGLTPQAADNLAARIGRHPAELWPEWCETEAAS